MRDNNFVGILRRACEEKVKVIITTDSRASHQRFIAAVGDDYVKTKWSIKEKDNKENFITFSSIESIMTICSEKKY